MILFFRQTQILGVAILVFKLNHDHGPAARNLISGEQRHHRVVPMLGPFPAGLAVGTKSDTLPGEPSWKPTLVELATNVRPGPGDDIKSIAFCQIEKALQRAEIELA